MKKSRKKLDNFKQKEIAKKRGFKPISKKEKLSRLNDFKRSIA